MGIKFSVLTKYQSTPPKLDELIHEAKDTRNKKKNEILVIIPCYHDSFRLNRYLDMLKKQVFRGFDIIIIFAKDDNFIDEPELPIYQVKRTIDFGIAGSVYLGQLFACLEGYKYFIFSDIDRIPYSETSIQDLYEAITSGDYEKASGDFICEGAFIPPSKIIKNENPAPVIAKGSATCSFSLIKVSVIEKIGLYFLPFYLGYDDFDYNYRMRGVKEKYINKTIWCYLFKIEMKQMCNGYLGTSYTDPTYLFPDMQGMRMCPPALRHVSLLKYFKFVFGRNFMLELLKRRIPDEMAQFEKMLGNNEFCKVMFEFDEPILRYDGVVENKEKYESVAKESKAVVSNMNSLLSLLEAMWQSDGTTTNKSSVIKFYAYNRIFYYDDIDAKKIQAYSWKKKISKVDKFIALSKALARTCVGLVGVYTFEMRGKKYPTLNYGKELLRR